MKAGFQVEIVDSTSSVPRSLATALAVRKDGGGAGKVIERTRGAMNAGVFKRPGKPTAASDPQQEVERKKAAIQESLRLLFPKLKKHTNKPIKTVLADLKQKARKSKQVDIIDELDEVEKKLLGYLEGLMLTFETLLALVKNEVLSIADIHTLTNC